MAVSRLNKLYQEKMLDSWATVNHLRELTWNAIWCIVFINALMPLVGCWHGYLSGARCRLAYGPADATATHCLLLQ